MTLRATARHIFVAPDAPPTRTRSGLALPQSAQRPAYTGTVVSAGPEVLKRLPDLVSGARVAFRPYAGRVLEVGGRELRLLEWTELYGILLNSERPLLSDKGVTLNTPNAPNSRTLDGSTPPSEAGVRGGASANRDLL